MSTLTRIVYLSVVCGLTSAYAADESVYITQVEHADHSQVAVATSNANNAVVPAPTEQEIGPLPAKDSAESTKTADNPAIETQDQSASQSQAAAQPKPILEAKLPEKTVTEAALPPVAVGQPPAPAHTETAPKSNPQATTQNDAKEQPMVANETKQENPPKALPIDAKEQVAKPEDRPMDLRLMLPQLEELSHIVAAAGGTLDIHLNGVQSEDLYVSLKNDKNFDIQVKGNEIVVRPAGDLVAMDIEKQRNHLRQLIKDTQQLEEANKQ